MDEKLRFYERQWNEEHKQRLELRKKLDLVTKERDEVQHQLLTLQANQESLTQECEALRKNCQRLQEQVAFRRRLQIKRDQQWKRLKRRVMQPGFWIEAVAVPFAKELEMFDMLPEVARQYDSGDPADMALEAAQLLIGLTQSFEQSDAAKLRRMLMAQWVYLRWLELTSSSGESC